MPHCASEICIKKAQFNQRLGFEPSTLCCRLCASFAISQTEQQRSIHRMQTRTPLLGFLPICNGPQRRHPRLRAVLAAALPLELQDFRGGVGLDN
jgi:hypothetical protein